MSAGKEVQRLNANGHANGWYAQQIQSRASRNRETMAAVYERESWKACAKVVPAKCLKISGGRVYYQFLDGSTVTKPHQPRKD